MIAGNLEIFWSSVILRGRVPENKQTNAERAMKHKLGTGDFCKPHTSVAKAARNTKTYLIGLFFTKKNASNFRNNVFL